jgi:hypothetical protein
LFLLKLPLRGWNNDAMVRAVRRVQGVANSIARRTTIETCEEEDNVDDGEGEEDVGLAGGEEYGRCSFEADLDERSTRCY